MQSFIRFTGRVSNSLYSVPSLFGRRFPILILALTLLSPQPSFACI